LQHLAHDHLDVLVVDAHTLQPVDLLDLVDQVLLHLVGAHDGEDVVRHDRAFGELFAGMHEIAGMDQHVLAVADHVDLFLMTVLGADDDLAHAALHLAEFDDAVDFADHGRLLGPPGFEELGDARQTAGDVAGFGDLARDLDNGIAGIDHVAVAHHQVGPGRDDVGAGDASVLIEDVDGGAEVAGAGLDDHPLTHARGLVHLLAEGDILEQVAELDLAGGGAENAGGVGVPFENDLALFHPVAGMDDDCRAVGNGEPLHIAVVVVLDVDAAVAADADGLAVFAVDGLEIVPGDDALVLDRDLRLGGDARGGTADVEGTQGELGARLADRLGRHDTHGLADADHLAGGQVASVTLGADPARGFAGEDRADHHRLGAGIADLFGGLFIDEGSGLGDDVARFRIENIFGRDAPDDAVLHRLDHLFTLLDVGHAQSEDGAAVGLGDDDILGDIDQTAGEIAGVGGLQGGIGQTLAGAVGGDKVLEHRQAFAEVGGDRVLDDFAHRAGHLFLRFGHQAAHAGELADLLFGTARARIGHHEDGIEALTVLTQPLEHLFGHRAGGVGPDVDDLVVALAVGDDAALIAFEDGLDVLESLAEQLLLFRRNQHVIEAYRGARLHGEMEADILEIVEELCGAVVAQLVVGARHEILDRLFGQEHVDEL